MLVILFLFVSNLLFPFCYAY